MNYLIDYDDEDELEYTDLVLEYSIKQYDIERNNLIRLYQERYNNRLGIFNGEKLSLQDHKLRSAA